MSAPVFTPSQLEAIDTSQRHRDACVVAGPGSGKTTVLVEYFKRLVEAGVDPLRILAITFTEKAAANMRKKLAETFHEDAAIRASLERAWVSTVHGFCARLLRENAIFAGVDPGFSLADERESWRLQHEAIAAAVAQLFDEHPAAVRALIRGLSSYEFEEAVVSAYDAMRGAGMTVEDVAALPPPEPEATIEQIADAVAALRSDPLDRWTPAQREHCREILEDAEKLLAAAGPREALYACEAYSGNMRNCKRGTSGYDVANRLKKLIEALPYTLVTELYTRERQTLLDILRRFDRLYREHKQALGVLDFADLEEYTVRLLQESPETRGRLQMQYEHILMDEFQDTNGQQSKLLQLVRRPDRFYAVGDINQSIFGFRHAEPEVFREYRDAVHKTGRRLIELVANFRSRPEILLAVETLAAGAEGIEPRELVPGRRFEDERPVSVEVMSLPDLATEAQWVAKRLFELLAEGGFSFKDVAVLVRNTEVIGAFTDAFESAGIPYVVNRGKGFYESREVKDLFHLLRVIANPRDEVSLAAVLRSPLVYTSDEALLRLKVRGGNLGAALGRLDDSARLEFDADDFRKLTRFRARLHEWRMQREAVSFDRPLLAALDESGYRCDSGSRGWPNIEKFLAQARAASGRMPLDEFVEHVALMRDDNLREPDAPPDDTTNAVNIMTVHSAKGLEFPIVFLAAVHKGVESGPPVLAFSRQYGLGASWRNPAAGREKDDLYQHAIREERKKRESEESDRLLYVAMTRAEQHLVMSFCASGKKLGNWAQRIRERLQLDLEQPRDEILTRESPDGRRWKLRLLVAAQAPEPFTHEAADRGETAEELVEWIAPPEIDGQHDTNATVTALAVFAKCPRQYYLGNYLGYEGRSRRLEDAARTDAGEFGSAVHALLAGTVVADPDPAAVAMAEVFRQSALGKRSARATRIEREFDFLMAVEGLVLRGQIDLWFEEGGELVIVDYKTDAVNAVEAHQRAKDYFVQLRLYALALERFTGRHPDRACLHFLRPNTAIEVDLTPSLLDAPEQVVRDFLEAQGRGRAGFPMQAGEQCQRCPFYRTMCNP